MLLEEKERKLGFGREEVRVWERKSRDDKSPLEIESKARNFEAILLSVRENEFEWWIHSFRQENLRTDKVS